MKLHQIHTQQKLPITIQQAWEFLTDPNNLKLLTPPEMEMTVLYGADRPMYPGQLIEYTVKPLPFLKSNWVTHITQVKDHQYFVDEQMYGPYKTWHHKHFITEIDGGTLMEDLIHYRLPMGWLGQLANPLIVAPKLEKIFKYRENALIKKFGSYQQAHNSTNLKHDILN